MKGIAHNVVLAALAAGLLLPSLGVAQVSPLEVIVNGRTEAATSSLSKDGLIGISESAGDIALYFAGLIGIVLGVSGILMLHRAQSEGDSRMTTRGWSMVFIGGLITVPALVAAFVPNILLNGL